MSSAATVPRSDRELVNALRAFPNDVLPVGLLRELAARGPAAEDELLRPLQAAIDDAGKGIGCLPRECFYCFGLLLAHPGVHLLPTLEGLLRLGSDDLDQVLGELKHPGTISMLVAIAKDDAVEETLAWIEQMIQDDSIDPWSRIPILGALSYLVRDAGLDRYSATDCLIGVLLRRKSQRQDPLSAVAVVELSNLGATEFESFVLECFQRGQIDEGFYCREDWLRESGALTTWQDRLEELDRLSYDIVEMAEWWYGFPQLSYSLDPRDANYEPNPASQQDRSLANLSDAEIDEYIAAIRNSDDRSFPRTAVEELSRHAAQAADRLIAEVRRGIGLAGGPESRSSNGPYLALTILIARDVPVPSDVLLAILDLPENDRMDLFGESIDSALVNAISLSLLGDTRPIDRRIVDSERSRLDREMLADFYPLTAWRGFLPRGETIERLMNLWRSVRDEAPSSRPESIFESLCMMSPQDHRSELLQDLEAGMGGWRLNPAQMREMLEDPSGGDDYVQELLKDHRHVMEMIESSVMFDQTALHPPRKPEPLAWPMMQPIEESQLDRSSTTVRNTTPRPGRNDRCPCGSGKKYKKCCAKS